MEQKLINLSTDVIREILLRLPSTSVLKFQCVCKLFHHLSSTTAFLSDHIERYRTNPPPYSLVLRQKRSQKLCIMSGVTTTNTALQVQTSSLTLGTPKLDCYYLELEASCDGLLCFRRHDKSSGRCTTVCYVVENPATREWTLLVINKNRSADFKLIGFYFHSPSCQYRMLFRFRRGGVRKLYRIYELGTDSLRATEFDTRYRKVSFYLEGDGPFLMHNRLHWLGTMPRQGDLDYLSTSEAVIIIFDIETEQFTDIPAPYTLESWPSTCRLMEIRGTLCVVVMGGFRNQKIEVWVLKDYERNIWIEKVGLVQDIKVSNEIDFGQTYRPLIYSGYYFLFSKDGDDDIAGPCKTFTFYRLEISAVKMPSTLSLLSFGDNLYRNRFVETFVTLESCKRLIYELFV